MTNTTTATDAQMMTGTDTDALVDYLYALEEGETFALRTERPGRSLPATFDYCVVTRAVGRDVANYADTGLACHYDVILEGERYNSPSSDYAEEFKLAVTASGEVIAPQLGPDDEAVDTVTTDTMTVEYDVPGNPRVMAVCGECGQSGVVPVDEGDLPLANPGMVRNDEGDVVTPCCGTEEMSTHLAFDDEEGGA